MTDDLERWIKVAPAEDSETTAYVQPGGCVEIRQKSRYKQPGQPESEMVHICGWEALALIVAGLRADRATQREAGFE